MPMDAAREIIEPSSLDAALSRTEPLLPISPSLSSQPEKNAPTPIGQTESALEDAVHLSTDFLKAPSAPHQPARFRFTLAGPAASPDPRTLVLAAWQALLHRYTGQADFSLCLEWWPAGPAAQVQKPRLATNVSVEGALTGRALLEQAGATMARLTGADASAHEDQLALVFVPAIDASLAAAEAAAGQVQADLHLIVSGSTFPLAASLSYDAGLFSAGTIERMAGHLGVLTRALGAATTETVAQLPLLTEAETRQLLHTWRPRQFAREAPPIHRAIERHAQTQPTAVAIRFRDQQLTYAQLEHKANQVANYLIACGVTPGARVAVCFEPSLDIGPCLLGIMKAGAVYVPLDPSYPAERLTVILEDTAPAMVITQARVLGRLPLTQYPVCSIDNEPRLDAAFSTPVAVDVALHDVAYIIYTSGTTGKPKGVMVSHGNLVHYIQVAADRYEWNNRDVMLAFARFSFSISFFELLSPLFAGGQLIILERDHVLDFQRLVPTLAGVTVMHASPSLLRRLVGYIDDNNIDLASLDGLRHVSSGGDMVAADLLEALKRVFRQAEVFVIYGCSEIACMGCTFPVLRDQVVRKSFVGKPFENVAVRIIDPYGNLAPIGVPGEICFSGEGISLGYLNREELTREKFVAIDGERFYRTGDVGRLDGNGNVEIVGRSDFQIKLRGFRIELGEIEATLRRAPGVREGVVAARALSPTSEDKSLVAYVVWHSARAGDRKEVRRFLQEKLPDYMIPAAFVVLDALPVNMNGKLDRKALPLPTAEDLASLRTIVPPRDERERKLVGIWEALLGTSPIGIQDNFFDVGGTSLLSLPLMIQIEKVFGKALPMSTLLTDATIEQLAAALGESDDQWRDVIVTLADGGPQTPLFLVHDGEGETLPYRTLAQRLRSERPVYGIHPRSRGGFPMLQTRLGDIAEFYAQEIRRVQPQGPYLVGGLCIGGFIAFEIAQRLQAQGQEVSMVLLIDAAHVQAEPAGWAAKKLGRFSSSLRESAPNLGLQHRVMAAVKVASRKISNVISYETKSRTTRLRNNFKVRALRYLIDNDMPIPAFLQGVPVRVILRFAEKEYVAPAPYRGNVALLRATKRDAVFDGTVIDDTPYMELFKAPALGWEGRTVPTASVYDIPGGHSSMLQAPNVDVVAATFRAHLAGEQPVARRAAT
jgi:amino acid adenylation domain-containing protein